jgi:hypothetical protein
LCHNYSNKSGLQNKILDCSIINKVNDVLDLYSSLVVYFKFSREFPLYDIACYHAIRYDAIKEVNVVLVLLDKSIIKQGV